VAGDIRIGISGWTYASWRGKFYPEDLPHARELHFASRALNTIEINGTFYSLQRPESFARWAAETPENFVFALKGPRFITHMKRLKEVEMPLANFLASGVLRLGPKLGPIVWQLPERQVFEPQRLEDFFALLPRDTDAALRLARRHDERLKGRAWLAIDKKRKLRHALEIRHPSFIDPAFIALLRRQRIALVCADSVAWPRLMDTTADFIYCRLHGSEELYASGYDDPALDRWARRVLAWAQGGEPKDGKRAAATPAPKRNSRDVFVYFDNDAKVRAPVDAQGLAARVARRLKRRAAA
jgi:uncharacterized protein YecE (DUF72 family)